MRAWLIPVNGEPPIELNKELTLVGRQENCNFIIDHKTISKMHCVLARAEAAILFRDLGSTNGCRINGRRAERGAVVADDILSIAAYDFRIFFGSQVPGATGKGHDRTEMIDLAEIRRLADDKDKPVKSNVSIYKMKE